LYSRLPHNASQWDRQKFMHQVVYAQGFCHTYVTSVWHVVTSVDKDTALCYCCNKDNDENKCRQRQCWQPWQPQLAITTVMTVIGVDDDNATTNVGLPQTTTKLIDHHDHNDAIPLPVMRITLRLWPWWQQHQHWPSLPHWCYPPNDDDEVPPAINCIHLVPLVWLDADTSASNCSLCNWPWSDVC